jgi:hypothetical protein
MPTTEPHEQNKENERRKRETQNGLIGAQVIHTLGKPGDLHDLQVRRLWEDHYRVNVFIGADAASAKIANSYFVKADSDGNIIESNPKIKNQY